MSANEALKDKENLVPKASQITHINGNMVSFDDGSEEHVDTIIY
jgi:hypothetical protein